MTKKAPHKLAKTITSFLDKDDWIYTVVKPGMIRFGIGGKKANYQCYIDVKEDTGVVLFYILSPIKVPEEKRNSVAEYLTRSNFGLIIGNFEMDFNDGEIRYKATLIAEAMSLSEEAIRRLIYTSLHTMNDYYDNLMKLIFNDTSQQVALPQPASPKKKPLTTLLKKKPAKTPAVAKKHAAN